MEHSSKSEKQTGAPAKKKTEVAAEGYEAPELIHRPVTPDGHCSCDCGSKAGSGGGGSVSQE